MDYSEQIAAFADALSVVTDAITDKPLNGELQSFLNAEFGPETTVFQNIEEMTHQGVDEGWLCAREHGGIKFGRVIKPETMLGTYSVDVVEMADIVGPHHGHPNGEIDMVMPLTVGAKFDDTPKGWKVYEPGTAHKPTVTDGAAYVLYLLPEGAIDFNVS